MTEISSLNFVSCLGLGGFGIVLKALDLNPSSAQSITAVKFIFPTESNATKEQILRECTLTINFNHANLIKMFTVTRNEFDSTQIETIFKHLPEDDDDLQTFKDTCIGKARRKKTIEAITLQMEFCGETLRTWLNLDHDINSQETLSMQFQICKGLVDGLAYLHENKVIHRDLKPENAMFSKPGFTLAIKIGDFGLCRIVHSADTQTSQLTSRAGTVDYMAPEAFTNDYSFPVDLFSLGLIIWEVVALLKFGDRKSCFHRLVHEEKENVVETHLKLLWSKYTIIRLTKRNAAERTVRIQEVAKYFEIVPQREEYVVRNNQQLSDRLYNIAPGGRIILCEGIYKGTFKLEVDGIDIVGCGSDTTLQGISNGTCLLVRSSGCTVSRVKINCSQAENCIGIYLQGSRNSITNISVAETKTCVLVTGNDNILETLTLENSLQGIVIEGSNTFTKIKIGSDDGAGFRIVNECKKNSNRITISNATGRNLQTGLWLNNCASNIISNVSLVSTSEKGCEGVWLDSSPNTTISNMVCTGYSRDKRDWGLRTNSEYTTLKNSQCGPILMDGGSSVFTSVDCGELIQIETEVDEVTLTNCWGQKLHDPGNKVTNINSNFTTR